MTDLIVNVFCICQNEQSCYIKSHLQKNKQIVTMTKQATTAS